MKALRVGFLTLASLALLGTAWARPLLLAPIRLSLPPATLLGYWHPQIEGDTLLVSAATRSNGATREAVHIFERASNGTWNYAGVLFEGAGSVHLEGTLAVVDTRDDNFVFERGPQGWTQTATIDSGPRGYDFPIGIDNGAIFMRRFRFSSDTGCVRADWVLRKVNGQWQEVATVGAPNCGDELHRLADINDGRALIVNLPPDLATPQPPAEVLTDTGAASWSRVATLPAPQARRFGASGSITSNWASVDAGYLYRNNGGNSWVFHGQLTEPEIELAGYSSGGVFRGNTLFTAGQEYDYELPVRDIYEIPIYWSTMRVYRPRANGFVDYYARLSVDFSVREWSASSDGRRVATTSQNNNFEGEAVELFVFEIPDSVSFAGTQQDTFESGNFSRWTPTAGQFAVAVNGATRVLRQSSLGGDSGAYLTALDWQDQSIEADLRPLEFAGNEHWFGLVARRIDARNFYYVTLRASGTISLRRVLDGVVTELAKAYVPPVLGRNYRVRLEAVGDQLAVSVDGIPRAHVKDSSFTHGHPGIAGCRARFEVDNVVVSSATRLLVRLDTTQEELSRWAIPPADLTGSWTTVSDASSRSGIKRQSDTSGNARWFSRTNIGNQVVSARVRPMSFGTTTGTQDPWVGIAAQVKDAQNFYYMTMRRSNQLSLRRVINGNVQVIATVPQQVTPGTWYDLRLEIIGADIRAFVNGDVKIQARDSTISGGGRNALLMYKTAADAASYVAYQP